MAHDVSYILHYNDWFHVYDHWYLKQFWYGLFPTAIIESIYIWQVWRHGRAELLPGGSEGAWLLYILAIGGLGALAWFAVKYFLDDPIYAWSFGSTGFLALFNFPRLLAKGDTRGQSRLMWVAYVGMQRCWFSTTFILFGPAFVAPANLAVAAACVLGGLLMAVACGRVPRAVVL